MTSNGPSIVYEWLKALQLCQYAESFVDNGYDDLEVCKQIGEPDLDAIGVFHSHHRNTVLNAVARLKEEDRKLAPGHYFTLEPMVTISNPHPSLKGEGNHKDSKSWTDSTWEGNGLKPRFIPGNNNLLLGHCQEPVTYPKLKLKIMIRDKLLKDGFDLGCPPYSKEVCTVIALPEMGQISEKMFNQVTKGNSYQHYQNCCARNHSLGQFLQTLFSNSSRTLVGST